MKKSNEQQTARDLFFQAEHSQAEIARQVGVDPKTVNLWVKHGKWKEIKQAARRTPSILVEQYFNQLSALNEAIDARNEGERYPSLKEAETMRKLIVCINTIQKQVSVGASIDVMQNLIYRIAIRDNDLANKVTDYAEEVLKSREIDGIKSHEVAYDWGGDSTSLRGAKPSHENMENAHEGSTSPQHENEVTTISEVHPVIDDIQAGPGQNIGNERALNEHEDKPASLLENGTGQDALDKYPPKCIRDPDDPYTFYYYKVTQRKFGSPKYGQPPDGFREVPKKDPVDIPYRTRGAGRY